MDYKIIYDNFMNDRLNKKPERLILKKKGEYFEGHHIVPKSKGGLGNSNRPKNNTNIVLLTPREHFLTHWLLWRIYRDRQTALAFHKMMSINKNQNRIKSSRGYEEARLAFRVTNMGNKYGQKSKKIISDEQKKRHSELMKGRYVGPKNAFYGKKHTDETKEKIRKSREGISKEKTWNYKGKKVLLLNGLFIKMFDTTKKISDYIGCSESNVRHVLCGAQKTAKGYEIKHFKEYYSLLS